MRRGQVSHSESSHLKNSAKAHFCQACYFRESCLSSTFQLPAGRARQTPQGPGCGAAPSHNWKPSCSHQLPPSPARWRAAVFDLITTGRSSQGLSASAPSGVLGGKGPSRQAWLWRGEGGKAFGQEEGQMAGRGPKWTPLAEPSSPTALHQGVQEASDRAICRQVSFLRKKNQTHICFMCLFSDKYSLPACPKHHTSPNPELHTQLCRGDGGEEGQGAAVQDLEQDVPPVLTTRPVTPAMRKTDVLQKVSRCLILRGMKVDSLDITFSSVFILC